MSIIVREANANDTNEIIKLWVELEKYIYDNLKKLDQLNNSDYLVDRHEHYEVMFNSDKYNVFVMEFSGELVGFIELSINEKDFNFEIDRYGYVAYFYVLPSYRDITNMSKLYNLGEAWFKSKGIEYICSDVDGENITSYKLQERLFHFKPYKIRMAKKI